jgi:signal transduction histidine kinase
VYQPIDGMYSVVWNLLRDPGTRITIVAFDENGTAIARHDMTVVVDLPDEILQTGTVDTDGGARGWLESSLRSLPPVVVYTFPFWLFLLLLILAGRYLWQTGREVVATERMRTLLKRHQLIAEEKDNFIALASHYLHTPLTVMRNGADTMVAIKEAPETVTGSLVSALEELKTRIDTVLGKVESNAALKDIKQPDAIQVSGSVLARPAFWLPVVAVCLIIVTMNLLLGLVGKWDFGFGNLTIQFIVGAIVIAFLFVAMRSHQLRRTEKEKLKQLVDYQQAIDTARTGFIEESTVVLREGLGKVEGAKTALPATQTANYVNEGFDRFADILSRFDLLKQLRAGADYGAAEKFAIQDAVDKIVADYQPQIQAKKLTVHVNMHGIKTVGRPALFNYVLQTVIDNAIKFTKEGGEITIGASKKSGKVDISITDNGIGIPAEKLPTLFKPFTRAGSALQFDYEGLGFSLFLDRIIMDYLDGDIDVTSREEQGTLVTVTA